MARLFVGHKPGVGGVVKVMRYDTDEPLTTPNENYGKFLFNSETSKLAYANFINSYKWDGAVPPNTTAYVPSGSNINTAQHATRRLTTLQWQFLFSGRIMGRGNVPLITEIRQKRPLGVERVLQRAMYQRTSENGPNTAGDVSINLTYAMRLTKGVGFGIGPFSEPIAAMVGELNDDFTIEPETFSSNRPNEEVIATIFDLPADSRPMPSTPVAASGTRNTLIVPSVVRIAKAGANAEVGGDSIIADSDHIPLKIVRAGQVDIEPGLYVDVLSPWPLTVDSYMDYMTWRKGQPVRWPDPIADSPFAQEYASRVTYAVFEDRVRIFNRGNVAVSVRFMICADNMQTTTGGSRIMRRLDDENIQIKRPGSSDVAPLSGDIVLDTRFSYFPIVAEGYAHYTEFTASSSNLALGDRYFDVALPNDGSYVPFVKFCAVTANDIFSPQGRVLRTRTASAFNGIASNRQAIVELTNTNARFWLAYSHPLRANAVSNGYTGNYDTFYRPIGIRYYIFAIPVSF